MVLLSKELVTIHCEVPVELELENMRTQAPDVSACRALFNELEFTTMLKELAPEEEATPLSIIPRPVAGGDEPLRRPGARPMVSHWPLTPLCLKSRRNRWQKRKARPSKRKSPN